MRKEENQFVNSTVFEGMTSIRAILHGLEAGIHDRTIEAILYDKEKAVKLEKDLRYLRHMANTYRFELLEVSSEEINEKTVGNTHGGLIGICRERAIPSLLEANDIIPNGFYAFIEGIEDPYNFGYALRSLYACGVNGIILGTRNWMTAAGVVARASAGASELLHLYTATPQEAIDYFHALHYTVVAADLRTEHTLGETPLKFPLLLVAGGEKRGISRAILDKADLLVKIPYARDFSASLSAASAVTMFSYDIMRQNRIQSK